MLVGAQPEGDDDNINPDAPATAHLEITFSTSDQEGVEDDDDARRNAQYFADAMTENFEDKYEEIHETHTLQASRRRLRSQDTL